MSDGTTTLVIQSLLERLRQNPNDPGVRKELITRSYERLAAVARRLLGPVYRDRPEDTSGLLAEAYFRLEHSLGAVQPESVRQYLGLAALQLRRALINLRPFPLLHLVCQLSSARRFARALHRAAPLPAVSWPYPKS